MQTIEKNEVALIPQITALELFQGGKVRSILDTIKEEVLSVVTDPTTEKGRKEIASLAHKVARTKVALDEMGKSLTDEQRKFIESINAERRVIVAELDELKEAVRRPLTEYENREKARVAKHEGAIQEIASTIYGAIQSRDALTIKEAIFSLENLDLSGFEEFTGRAETEKAAGLHRLSKLSEELHAERIERERIAKEKAEAEAKERAEREARIAAEAAEKARIEAERKAAEEARKAEEAREAERRAEAERLAAIEREKAEAERKATEAEERARREAEQREFQRIAGERAEKEKAEKIAANRRHRDKIRQKAVGSLVSAAGITEPEADRIISIIDAGQVEGVSINY